MALGEEYAQLAGSAYRLTASCEGGRLDVGLPAGEAVVTRNRGAGTVEQRTLFEPPPPASAPGEIYGSAMRKLVTHFIDRLDDGGDPHAPLAEEAHVRAVWAALERAAREHTAIEVS